MALTLSGGVGSSTFGDDTIITFTSDGTIVSDQSITGTALVVGGGGGGGTAWGAGGGAGGLLLNTSFSLSADTYPITVGQGGTSHQSGGTSIFGTIEADGGGFGGNYRSGQVGENGGDGGCGGGGAGAYGAANAGTGGVATSGQGFDGGVGTLSDNPHAGGGGGASEEGNKGGTQSYAGDGTAVDITGTSTYYAGGGAGCLWGGTRPASLGGGGASSSGTGQAGTDGLGGGGGGGAVLGGAGGDGVVIYRVLTADITAAATGGIETKRLMFFVG